MSYSWTCPVCGTHTNHFSRTANALVCDVCGNKVQSEAERNEDINFERNMVLARDHLKVGNWEEAKRLVKPFCQSRPADKQLYLMLLVAVTKCFTDFLFHDEAKRREAAEYWDKLERLGCVNTMMREYARRRIYKINELKSTLSAKKGISYGLCALFTFITFCCILSGDGAAGLFVVISILGWIIAVKYNSAQKQKTNLQACLTDYNSTNPFR